MVILDGWGLSPDWGGNPITMNNPANMTRLWREYPHKVLQAFGLVSGKYGIVGDSRLGHSTISAGRRIIQDYEKISASVENKSFYHNAALCGAFTYAKKHRSSVHLIGLFSKTGIHSHLSHLEALLDLAARENFSRVFIDAITDGIDSSEYDGLGFIEEVEQKILRLNLGQFSSISGRFYAMDRDRDYKKPLKVHQALVEGKALLARDPVSALTGAYKNGLNDFNIEPTLLGPEKATIKENDAVIFFNFRSDRAIQLAELISKPDFRVGLKKFKNPKNLYVVTMTMYRQDLAVKEAFVPEKISKTLPEILSDLGKVQLRVAETEKTAHVTTFFNCGEEIFKNEIREIVPSKKVKDWSRVPQMSATKIGKVTCEAIGSGKYDFIVVNFGNVDMMAHTGNFSAAGEAVKIVDSEVGKIVQAGLKAQSSTIITADHGNVEQIVKYNPKQDPENKHTLNPVPFILVSADNRKHQSLREISPSATELGNLINVKATLADVAPTILELMDLPKPEVMTGKSLLRSLE